MPITASYTWSEKKDTVKVLIPLKGVSAAKADVSVSASTLKVNFAPYILDLVLFKEIDSVRHKATVKDGVLNITLCKKEVGVWGTLIADGSKEDLESIKRDASVQQVAFNENLDAQRHERKLAEEKNSLRKQMKLEEMERTRVENMKLEEKTTAEREVYDVFAKMQASANTVAVAPRAESKTVQTSSKKAVTFGTEQAPANIDLYLDADDIDEVHPSPVSYEATKVKQLDLNDIDEDFADEPAPPTASAHDIYEESVQDIDNFEDEEEEVRYVPPPRSTGLSANADQKIGISFTPRVFPTPMRESKAAEEEDWVAKNRRHIKKHGVLGKNNAGDVSEEDPVWLKAKGDDFFRSGDMRSALNAYSAALDTDPRMLPCLANRSVCLLRCGQPAECRADCSAALQLIAEEDQASTSEGSKDGSSTSEPLSHAAASTAHAKNAVVVVKLLMRRGAAACQMGLFTEALTDFLQSNVKYQKLSGQQASALPGVSIESIAGDVARLRLLVDAEALKKEGDSLFAERNTTEALLKYNAALGMIPVHVSCLSNRAACRMAQQDLAGCVADCSTAIALLQSDSEGKFAPESATKTKELRFEASSNVLQQDQIKTMLFTILPPAGSTKRSGWILKTLLRRGVALAQLNQFSAAVQDYERAVALDPTNEAVKADLLQMIAARDRATEEEGTPHAQ